jgi:hypothetical protein
MRVTWSPRVTRDERATFEAKARVEGLAGYTVKTWAPTGAMSPAPERDEYFPARYSTDLSKDSAGLGIDLASEPMRREALERARDGDRIGTRAQYPAAASRQRRRNDAAARGPHRAERTAVINADLDGGVAIRLRT